MTSQGATDLDVNYNLVNVQKEDVQYVARGTQYTWIKWYNGDKMMVNAKCKVRVVDRFGHVSLIHSAEESVKPEQRHEVPIGFAALFLLSLGLLARLLR